MEKQKANKFPLVKLFTVDGASCYLYDGRANMFLSLSETEKNLVCEYMASYGTSEGEPCPASFSSDAAAFIARLNGNGILLPGHLWKRGHLPECAVRKSYGNNGRRKPFLKN